MRSGWAMIVFGIGFLLSPLTWWNDLFINVPISWALASLFGTVLFKRAFLVIYWVTNILGLLMMHYSGTSAMNKRAGPLMRHGLFQPLLIASIYSLLLWLAMYYGIIKPIDINLPA